MTQRHPILNEVMMLVTTVTKDRQPIFSDSTYAREAIETLYRVQQLHPFFLHGFVVMHDHCHILMTIPAPETISKIMNVFKSGVTSNIGIPRIWQQRYHVRIVENAVEALAYIHGNPVKAGLVLETTDYPWSSASGKWDITDPADL